MDLADLIATLNARAGSTGFGRLDMVENRRVGIKSREVYECPAALALIAAHADLEDLVLERDVAPREGPTGDALGRTRLRRHVVLAAQGGARRLHRRDAAPRDGRRPRCVSTRRDSCASSGDAAPIALYDYGLATYDAADTFRHARLRGLRRHLRARREDLGRSARARRTRRRRS